MRESRGVAEPGPVPAARGFDAACEPASGVNERCRRVTAVKPPRS